MTWRDCQNTNNGWVLDYSAANWLAPTESCYCPSSRRYHARPCRIIEYPRPGEWRKCVCVMRKWLRVRLEPASARVTKGER